MKREIKLLLLVCTALTVLALGSCEVIAAGSGGTRSSETVWIRLIPEPPFHHSDGIYMAKLMLDLSKPIDGLETGLNAAGLAEIFTIDFDYSKEIEPLVKMEITNVVKYADAFYVLTVAHIPASGGIARVIINRTGIAPSFRLWSLDGHILPDEDGPAMLDFRFEAGGGNPSLGESVRGNIDQVNGRVVVVAPSGTLPGSLTPTVTVNEGSTFTPEGAQDFSGAAVPYTVTSEAGETKVYEVTVQVQQSNSASIELFQFRSVDNYEQGWETDAVGDIDGTDISVTVPFGTDRTSLKPTITWMGASIEPDDAARDWTNAVEYTVRAEDGTTAVYTVTVSEAIFHSITLSVSGTHSFPDSVFIHGAPPPALSVTVTNTGNQPTGALSIALPEGTESFTLSSTSLDSLELGGTASFTVRPSAGLTLDTYTAVVTVSGANASAHFNADYTVRLPHAQNAALATGTDETCFNSVAMDADGNTYAVGYHYDYMDVRRIEHSGKLIVKYDSDGVVLWENSLNDYGYGMFSGVAIDKLGNLYAVGYSGSSSTYSQIMKFDCDNGDVLWSKSATEVTSSGSGYFRSSFRAAATDESGNVYVVGYQYNSYSVKYDNVTVSKNDKQFRAVLVKYNSDGYVQWVKSTTNSTVTTEPDFQGVAVDECGDVYVAGYLGGGMEDFGNGVSVSAVYTEASGHNIGTGNNALLVKYNGNGDVQWAKSVIAAPYISRFYSVAADGLGSVYAVGEQFGQEGYNYGCGNVYGSGEGDNSVSYAVIVKYDSDGEAQWAKSTSNSYEQRFTGVAADKHDNICAVGFMSIQPGYPEIVYDFGDGVICSVPHYESTGSMRVPVAVRYGSDGKTLSAHSVIGGDEAGGGYFWGVAADGSGSFTAAGEQGNYLYTVNYGNGQIVTGATYERTAVAVWYK
jgi:hypothetical protein